MMKKNLSAAADQSPEYCVYVHHPRRSGTKNWERASVTKDRSLALEQAEMLYHSNRYEKIEIQKLFFCKNRKKRIGQTLRIFDLSKQKKKKQGFFFFTIAALTTLCLLAAGLHTI